MCVMCLCPCPYTSHVPLDVFTGEGDTQCMYREGLSTLLALSTTSLLKVKTQLSFSQSISDLALVSRLISHPSHVCSMKCCQMYLPRVIYLNNSIWVDA